MGLIGFRVYCPGPRAHRFDRFSMGFRIGKDHGN